MEIKEGGVKKKEEVDILSKEEANEMLDALTSHPTITGCQDFNVNLKVLDFIMKLRMVPEDGQERFRLGLQPEELKNAKYTLAAMSLVLAI